MFRFQHSEVHTITPTSSWLRALQVHVGHSRTMLPRFNFLWSDRCPSPPTRVDPGCVVDESLKCYQRLLRPRLPARPSPVARYIQPTARSSLAPPALASTVHPRVCLASRKVFPWSTLTGLGCLAMPARSPRELRSFALVWERERPKQLGVAEGNPVCPA